MVQTVQTSLPPLVKDAALYTHHECGVRIEQPKTSHNDK